MKTISLLSLCIFLFSHSLMAKNGYDTGFIIKTSENTFEYNLVDHENQLKDQTDAVDGPYWKFFYTFKYGVDTFSDVACFFGNKKDSSELFYRTLNSEITLKGRDLNTVISLPSSEDVLKFEILDTRDPEEFGRKKIIEIQRCEPPSALLS
jgi:hypothetical protein